LFSVYIKSKNSPTARNRRFRTAQAGVQRRLFYTTIFFNGCFTQVAKESGFSLHAGVAVILFVLSVAGQMNMNADM
jgi:hypothetical protein